MSIRNATKDQAQFDSTPSPGAPNLLPRAAVFLPAAAVVVISAYIGAQMLADFASLKIGVVYGMAVDMGTFIYPITFTLRDVAHKVLGKQATRWLIVMAAVVNLFAAFFMGWVQAVPSDASWGQGEAWASIFSPQLLWRIVLASILAELVSELLDTEIYHWFVTRVTRRFQWARVLLSNSVSVPVDNLIFAVGAFAGILPWDAIWQIFIFNLVAKYLVTLLSMPLIYATPREQE